MGEYCDKKFPPQVRDKLRLSYKTRGNMVTIFEERAPWRQDMKEWTSMPMAQIRYDEKKSSWTLYCADRNSKWHKYVSLPPTKDLDDVLAEIDADPTGAFWG